MRKFIVFVGYLLSVAILFIAFDFVIGYILDHFCFLKSDSKLEYAFNGGGGEDLVFLGASRASHHYVPSVFEEELGLTSFNYGMDGRNIFNQYIIASELLKNASIKPKYAILEVAYIDIEDTPGWNNEKLSNLYVLYKKDKSLRTIIEQTDKKKAFVLWLCNSYRYNSLLLSLLKASIVKDDSTLDMKGYIPLQSKWASDIQEVEENDAPVIHPLKEYYLRSLLQLFKESQVELMVINSPEYYVVNHPRIWTDRVSKVCEENGISFLDFDNDSLFVSHKEWFNEPFHLNHDGACIYSGIVARKIKESL